MSVTGVLHTDRIDWAHHLGSIWMTAGSCGWCSSWVGTLLEGKSIRGGRGERRG